MAGYRINRINEEMLKEMAEIVRTVKDPRVQKHFVSITRCDVTQDLKFAKVYFSVLDENEEIKKEVEKGLESSKGYIRREVSMRLNLRNTPELTFIPDESFAHGAKINKILSDLNKNENKEKE